MIGFDPLVNQRLLPPSFPRQTQIFTQEKVRNFKDNFTRIFTFSIQ